MDYSNTKRTFWILLVGFLLEFVQGGSDDHDTQHIDDSWRCPKNLPDSTVTVTFNNKCYQYVDSERYWPSARDYCYRYKGHLVTINDPDTNDFLVWTLNNLPWRNKGVWIGLHDRDSELDWEWITDHRGVAKAMTWNNWGRGHPRATLHTFRDCVRMVRGNGDWRWHETPCSMLQWKYKFICEYNMRPLPTTTEAPIVNRHVASGNELRRSYRGDHPGNTYDDDQYEDSSEEEEDDDNDDDDENDDDHEALAPLELKQDEISENVKETAESTSSISVVIAVCVLGILLVTVILAIIFIRRRRKKRFNFDDVTMTMENPVYGNGKIKDVSLPRWPGRPENEYVVNVYSNPMPVAQQLVVKNQVLAEAARVKESPENRPQENTESVVRNEADQQEVISQGDGYEQPVPRSPDYLPMDGSSPWEEPSNTEVVIRRPRPISDAYVLPQDRDSHIYSEIPDEVSEERHLYETLDDVKRQIVGFDASLLADR